jgi:cell division protein FtsN
VATPSKGNVVNLMEALQASIKTTGKNEPTAAAKAGKPAKKVSVEPPVDDVPPVDEPGKPPAELAAAARPADPRRLLRHHLQR